MKNRLIVVLLSAMAACTNNEEIVDKSKLLANDYRLFQGTPAWNLAKAAEIEDTDAIQLIINKHKELINYGEPQFGTPILGMAVKNKDFKSVKMLLELGADPNKPDIEDGISPIMDAARIGLGDEAPDDRFLKALLKFGGNPNTKAIGRKSKTAATALTYACAEGNLNYVKLLVSAGGDVNQTDEKGDGPLKSAATSNDPDIIIFLINSGVNYKDPLYKIPGYKNVYLTDMMRYWRFDHGSERYKKKMWIVDFLKANGMDYRKTEIPQQFLKDYSKEYLEKY